MPYLEVIGLISHHGAIINNNQSWPSLQQTSLNWHKSAAANHRPGKPDTISQHASVKLDTLSQHAKCIQAILACLAKIIVYKGLEEPRTVDKLWESEEPDTEDLQSQHYNTSGS